MKAHDDTLNNFLASLQFKLGHIAGDAQQVLDWSEKNKDAEFADITDIEKLAKSIQDSALHISAALKGLSK